MTFIFFRSMIRANKRGNGNSPRSFYKKKGFFMNRSYLASFFACLIFNTTTLYTSEKRGVVQALPSWNSARQILKKDYKTYLQNRLEEYKKTDIDVTPINMDELVTMGVRITGYDRTHEIGNIADEAHNRFIHIAIEKDDLPAVQWICANPKFIGTPINKKGQSPLDLCIEKLTPCSIDQQKDSVTHKILYALIERTAKVCSPVNPYKTACLKKITALHLAYKQASHELDLTPELIRCLISAEKLAEEQAFLSTIYQETTDADGNTFTHVLVEKELADELFDWIKQGRVSFAKNKAQLTPVDTALANFRFFTQNVALIDGNTTSFARKKCCLFMLLNYLKIKSGQAANTHFNHCCSNHIVTQ